MDNFKKETTPKCVTPKRPKLSDLGPGVNPLLVDLVLEVVLPYCKDARDNWTVLQENRLVCKLWDNQLSKMIRQDTEINLSRLISPYPEGFGWREDASKEEGFVYQCPYPVTSAFENVVVSGTCEELGRAEVLRWWEIMGGTVKRLRFNCRLTCYHGVRFLECVLKQWGGNLKTLYLEGVECIYSLVHNSKFGDNCPLICGELEELILSDARDMEELENASVFQSCQENLLQSYLNRTREGVTTTPVLAADDPAYRAFGLQILKRLSRNFTEAITPGSLEFIRNTTGSDGGVLGQILKTSKVTKFNIKRLPVNHCQDFLTFLNVQPLKIRETLEHLSFDDFPISLNSVNIQAFSLLRFPLKSLHIGVLFARPIRTALRDLLASYADTLEHLEFSGNVMIQDWTEEQDEEYLEVTFPPLPKLKRFVNRNIFGCRLQGLDFLANFPILEKCSLSLPVYHSSIYPLTPAEVFNLLFQAANFEEVHPLKELRLEGKICYNNHLEMIQSWFPGLVKVDLKLEGADVFVDFLRMAKEGKMEEVKVAFLANDNEWCNAGIVNNVGDMKSLKFLELIHLPDSPLTITTFTCEAGFAKAPKLTSLKLTNFGIFADELEAIRACLFHISCVKLSKTVIQHKPVDLEFSVGISKSISFTIQSI